MRPGAGFLIEGTAENNPSLLAGADTIDVQPATNPAEPDAIAEDSGGK
jgi:hypothetical protein